MNENYLEIPRRRHQNLLIVEGNHEKNKLFQLIFKIFPEIDISIDDVWIYGTNIYILYNDIVKEYGDEWYEDDVDLAFVVGKKKNHSTILNKKDFTNIFLIFDYEHHDPNFSEPKINHMQQYFSDSTDIGKLYINYPMIESYEHFNCLPDSDFSNLTVSVNIQPGTVYKRQIRDLFISKLMDLPQKLTEILTDRYGIGNNAKCKKYVHKLLEISNSLNLVEQIYQILIESLSEPEISTAKHQISSLLESMGYIQNNISYYEHMRGNFIQIILHNISKGIKIQDEEIHVDDYRVLFESLDLSKILDKQNNLSKDIESGCIWVLNTSVFLVPDYNFTLIK